MESVLGIDIGTSSIKLLVAGGGRSAVVSRRYPGPGAEGMLQALREGLHALYERVPPRRIARVGLCGQTGTYVWRLDDGDHWLPWYEPGREEFVAPLLKDFSPERFRSLIGMDHPRLSSYPLPTMLYLRAQVGEDAGRLFLMQPKDYLCLRLTGRAVTDPWSWRGLARAEGGYAEELLRYAGFSASQLPEFAQWARVSAEGAALTGLPEGVPVAVGCNDFYAALLGAGINGPGRSFDITGTSEHLGVTLPAVVDTPLISSPFPGGAVHYGVTASSGKALAWASRLFGRGEPSIPERAPVFLPYIHGERAPVFDEKARGLFLGLGEGDGRATLCYSVLEGVVFSLYDIYEHMGRPPLGEITVTGGGARNRLMNTLKASLFGVPVRVAGRAAWGSAAGAAVMAGAPVPRPTGVVLPDEGLGQRLRERFALYRRLYDAYCQATQGLDTEQFFT